MQSPSWRDYQEVQRLELPPDSPTTQAALLIPEQQGQTSGSMGCWSRFSARACCANSNAHVATEKATKTKSSTNADAKEKRYFRRNPFLPESSKSDDTAFNYFMHVWSRAPWVNYLYDGGRGAFVFTSDSKLMIIRDITMFLAVMWTALVAPLEFASASFLGAEAAGCGLLADLFFILDVPFHFFVAVDKRRATDVRSVFDRKVIAREYVRGWLLVDLISAFPFEWYQQHIMANGHVRIQVSRFIMLIELVRISKLHRGKLFVRFDVPYFELELLRCATLAFISSHWLSCVWICIGSMEGDGDTWVDALVQSKVGLHGDFGESLYAVYLWAFYFAATLITTVGFGDITPQNNLECVIAVVGIAAGSVIWAIILSSFIEILNGMDKQRQKFEYTMDELNRIAQCYGLPDALRHDIRTYFFECEELWRFQSRQNVIERMSPTLQGRTALALNRVWLECVPCFQLILKEAHQMPDAMFFFVSVSKCLIQKIYPKGEALADMCLHVVQKGCLSAGIVTIVPGQIWGEDTLCMNPENRGKLQPICLTTSSMLSIEVRKLHEILEMHPRAKSIVRIRALWIACKRGLGRELRNYYARYKWNKSALHAMSSNLEQICQGESRLGETHLSVMVNEIGNRMQSIEDQLKQSEKSTAERLTAIENMLQRLSPGPVNVAECAS